LTYFITGSEQNCSYSLLGRPTTDGRFCVLLVYVAYLTADLSSPRRLSGFDYRQLAESLECKTISAVGP